MSTEAEQLSPTSETSCGLVETWRICYTDMVLGPSIALSILCLSHPIGRSLNLSVWACFLCRNRGLDLIFPSSLLLSNLARAAIKVPTGHNSGLEVIYISLAPYWSCSDYRREVTGCWVSIGLIANIPNKLGQFSTTNGCLVPVTGP